MARQEDIPLAATVLGTIGTVLWCVQLVPQIWTNWKTKKTDGLPVAMMFLWAVCGVPLGAYSIVQNFNIPIQIQPQIFMSFCLVSFCQILYYNHDLTAWMAVLIYVACAGTFAGVEAALILTLRPLYNRGSEMGIMVVGIISSVLLVMGLLPPYVEIWKRRGRVVGINWVFLSMDWAGAVFSLMALVAQNTFDILGGVIYIVCAALEVGIFLSHIIWLARTHSIRKAAKAEGKTFDDVAAEYDAEGRSFAFAQREIDPRLSLSRWCRCIAGKERKHKSDEEACTSTQSARTGDEERANNEGPRASAAEKETAAGGEKQQTNSSSGQ